MLGESKMSDLISRESLLEEIKENRWGWFSKELMLRILENQPTVEAVPVVHGEWIKTFKSMKLNLNTGELEPKYSCDCSICKWHTGNQGTRFNFCPNCGADMRNSKQNK